MTIKKMPEKCLKIAVVGCGYWGPNLIRNFFNNKNCRVELVVDKDFKRLNYIKTIYPTVAVSGNIADCFRKDVCDAVVISLPVSLHYKVVELALDNYKHVFCEKPLARTVSQSANLFKLAKKNEKILFVDYTYLYSNEVKYLKKICRQLRGDVYTVHMRRLSFGIFQKDADVIFDLAPHDISILVDIFGKPDKVFATGQAHVNGRVVDDAHLTLIYDNGPTVQIHVSWLFPKKVRDIMIVAGRKTVYFDDTKSKDKIEIIEKGLSLKSLQRPQYYATYKDFFYKSRVDRGFTPKITKAEPLKAACEEFVKQVFQNQLSQAGLSLNVAEVLEACEESLRKRSFVNV